MTRPSAFALTLVALLACATSRADTFVVTSTADSGPGSLREAITRANATNELDFIELNLGMNAVIALQSALPEIVRPLAISATNAAPERPLLLGTTAGETSGLVVRSDNVAITGIAVAGFQRHGIEVLGHQYVGVNGCSLGVGPNFEIVGNRGAGIYIEGGENHSVWNCIISGNEDGVRVVGGTFHVVQANFIGAVSTEPNAAPLKAGNRRHGVYATSTVDLQLGGYCHITCPRTGNWIGGNAGSGMQLSGERLQIIDNDIGSIGNWSNSIVQPNGAHGVSINGGTATIAGNEISRNHGDGIRIVTGRAGMTSNSILDNDGLPVDLGGDGPTPNDVFDADDGPNHLQNKPLLMKAEATDHGWYVKGQLSSKPSTRYRIDLVPTDDCGTPYTPEPFTPGAAILTDERGNADFYIGRSGAAPVGGSVAAVASADAFSEYSNCVQVQKIATNIFDLAVTMQPPVAGAADGIVMVTSTIENKGPAPAFRATAEFTSSPALTLLAADSTKAQCSEFVGGRVVCNIEVLVPGERLPINLFLRPGANHGTISVRAYAAVGEENFVGDNSTSHPFRLTYDAATTATDLDLTVTHQQYGNRVIATYRIRNKGTNAAVNTVFDVSLPARSIMIRVESSEGSSGLPWRASRILPGGEIEITVEAALPGGSAHTIDAFVTSLNDSSAGNNRASFTTRSTTRTRSLTAVSSQGTATIERGEE